MSERARLTSGITLPAYSYVPGRRPHPFTDPLGHRFGHDLPEASAPDPKRWADSLHYLLGLDLFNHGYYWEAHEAWESLWHACGRTGAMATFFKALIQLAVVGVKAREQKPAGVLKHAKRAQELFQEIGAERWMGFALPELIALAEQISAAPPISRDPDAAVETVFAFALLPAD